jgi:iron-sulfur cluster assembly accessory protein
MIHLSEQAELKIMDILLTTNENTRLRIAVVGGGCAGLNYHFVLDEDFSEDDFLIDSGPARVVVDSVSAQYLEHATVDYVDELWEKKFVVDNPNAEVSCGCGTSFAPKRS